MYIFAKSGSVGWISILLFGGAEPIRELSNPRLTARPSPVHVEVTAGELEIAGLTLEAIPLHGHTGAHTGYRAGRVFFVGDALAGDEDLARAGVLYGYSITQRLESLTRLETIDADWFVPGHGPLLRDARPLVARNRQHIEQALASIQSLLARHPSGTEDVMAGLGEYYRFQVRKARDCYLLSLATLAHLSHLRQSGKIDCVVEDNRLLWVVPA